MRSFFSPSPSIILRYVRMYIHRYSNIPKKIDTKFHSFSLLSINLITSHPSLVQFSLPHPKHFHSLPILKEHKKNYPRLPQRSWSWTYLYFYLPHVISIYLPLFISTYIHTYIHAHPYIPNPALLQTGWFSSFIHQFFRFGTFHFPPCSPFLTFSLESWGLQASRELEESRGRMKKQMLMLMLMHEDETKRNETEMKKFKTKWIILNFIHSFVSRKWID